MSSAHSSGAKDRFCILPWIHLAVFPDNTTRLCCVANHPVCQGDVPLSMQTHSLEQIWNSDHLRHVRRRLAEGHGVADCAHCYHVERAGGRSHRMQMNERWLAELGPLAAALVEQSQLHDYELSDLPIYYQLMPGNLCNLKCRMCSPVFSSQIERDPVHSNWYIPSTPLPPLDWTRGRVVLGPQPLEGVHCEGFHALETTPAGSFRWTQGRATLAVFVPKGVRPTRLVLRLRRRAKLLHRQRLRIFLNDVQVHDGHMPYRHQQLEVPVPPGAEGQKLTVRFESGTVRVKADPRTLGVALAALELIHEGAAEPPPRLPNGPWYRDDVWVREVLLQNADRLRGLYFSGGEPMIEKQVEHVLDHLLAQGVAGNIVLEMNTNATVLRDHMLAKLSQFKKLHIGLSIDAAGVAFEYIRFPARWDKVRRNIERLMSMPRDQWQFTASVVLQAYNLLQLDELLQFLDRHGVDANIQIAEVPRFLAVAELPARVRSIAADRMRAFAAGPYRPSLRASVLEVARRLETMPERCTPEGLRTLMLFTNDLDGSRRQDVRAVHGELLQLLEECGFHWTDECSTARAA